MVIAPLFTYTVRFCVTFLSLLLVSFPGWALTNVEATVDQNPVVESQAFTLQVTADDSLDSDAFDNSALLRLPVIVGSTSVSRQVSTINGKTTKQTSWSTTLVAQQPGEFTIPAMTINGISSKPFTLSVHPKSQSSSASKLAGTSKQAVELVASLDKTSALPGEMLLYTVKLYISTELARGAQLSEPQLTGATIFQIGKQQQETEIMNGKRVNVVTLQYGIAIDNVGQHTITGPTLEAKMVIQSGSGFYARQRLEPVLVTAQPQAFTISTMPDNIPANTPVTPLLSLSDNWKPDNTQINVGDAITRTITMTVANQHKDDLPELHPEYPSSIRHYTDATESQQIVKQGALLAQRIHKEAIIATQPGELTIPALTVPWYNSDTKQLEVATLPARTFTVLPGNAVDTTKTPSTTMPLPETKTPAADPVWKGLTALFALLWLMTLALFIWVYQRRPVKAMEHQPAALEASDKTLKTALNSLKQNAPISPQQAMQVRQAILQWEQQQHPTSDTINNLGELPYYQQIQPWLSEFDAATWANSQQKIQTIDGMALYKQLIKIKQQRKISKNSKLINIELNR